jgi:hypothetical protein
MISCVSRNTKWHGVWSIQQMLDIKTKYHFPTSRKIQTASDANTQIVGL